MFTNKSEEIRISLGEERIADNIKRSRWDAPPKIRVKTGMQRVTRNCEVTQSWVNSEEAIQMAKNSKWRAPSNVM